MSDDKAAIRSAAIGQDFGSDTAAFDPNAPVTEAVEQDHRGTVQIERQSYEWTIEGLRKAADGARNMAWQRPRFRNEWNKFAASIDKMRKWAVLKAGYGRLEDAKESLELFSETKMGVTEAMSRLRVGLSEASSGADQIALGQRLDFEWKKLANGIVRYRDAAQKMALASSPRDTVLQWGGGTPSLQ